MYQRCPCPTSIIITRHRARLKFREGTLFDAPPIAAKLDVKIDEDERAREAFYAGRRVDTEHLALSWPRATAHELDLVKFGRLATPATAANRSGSSPAFMWRTTFAARASAALVQRLLERHTSQGRALTDTFLLTLEPTVNWYEQFGFERLPTSRVPKPMELEVKAGEALSAVLGNKLVAMQGAERPQ